LFAIKRHFVRTAVVGALGVTALAGFVAPASAVQVAAPHMANAPAVAAKPNTNIEGGPLRWVPNKLTAPPTSGTCSSTNYSFSITNRTAKAHEILYKIGTNPKKVLGTLKAHQKAAICDKRAKGSKTKFYIKGSTSVLTVTLS
jgi:hypothetical protein